MPKCKIDGIEVEFTQGQNLIEVAKKVGIEIPFFCYHPGLSVVAQCRMCAVEIEKSPKLQTACSTPAAEGMVVHTRSAKAKANQASVMEFLLVNHPLDCPICDKSGECDLQDNSYKYGDSTMRTSEERRTYLDLDMGPVIKKNMNRCIHCTRCIRFGDEIAGIREMVAIQRGNNTEISTIDGRPLESDYSGNYSDICPTGSLTLKDFRFKKRAWFLSKTATVCEGCSRGCNMEIQHDQHSIYRCVPRENLEINKYWLCDEGRFNYQYTQSETRIITARVNQRQVSLIDAIQKAKEISSKQKNWVLLGTDLTNEEAELMLQFIKEHLKDATVRSFSGHGIETSEQDGHEDKILKMKSKTSNLKGLEKLGIQSLSQADTQGMKTSDVVWVLRGGRAVLPELPKTTRIIGLGVFHEEEILQHEITLPLAAFTEKNGSITNFQGVVQNIKRAITPPGDSKELSEILMYSVHSKLTSPAMSSIGVA